MKISVFIKPRKNDTQRSRRTDTQAYLPAYFVQTKNVCLQCNLISELQSLAFEKKKAF